MIEIDCQVLRDSEIFIDSEGYILPCCWVGSKHYKFMRNKEDHMLNDNDPLKEIFTKFGTEKLNVKTNGFNSALRNVYVFLELLEDEYWPIKKPMVCKTNCGKK